MILAALVPHPPLILPPVGRGSEAGVAATSAAYRRLAAEITAAAPETIVVISPHADGYADAWRLSAGDSSIVGALRHFARTDKTVFITHELTPERKALLQEGVIDAIIDQNPELEAMTAVQLLARHFGRSGEEALPTTTPARIYIRENC